EGEDLYVLDPGSLEGEVAPYGVHVFRFGPGGSLCPAASSSVKLTVASSEVSTVPAGTSVTLDGTPSELGLWATEESVTWKVEGPGGNFEQTVPSSEPSPFTLDHVFSEAGEYTVRMKMKVSGTVISAKGAGTVFAAKAKKLTVTSVVKHT